MFKKLEGHLACSPPAEGFAVGAMETLTTSLSRSSEEDLAQVNSKHRSKSKLQPYLQRVPARAHLLLNEAELLHFTYNLLNNRVVLSAAYKHSHKRKANQQYPIFTSKIPHLFLKR